MKNHLVLALVFVVTGYDSDGEEIQPQVFSSEEAATEWIAQDEGGDYDIEPTKVDAMLYEDEEEEEEEELEDA